MGKTGESTTLNSFGITKQEIESKKDLLKIFCCLAFLRATKTEKLKPLINFRILQMSMLNVKGEATEWQDYRKSINKLL
jgi:hypothetical protein